MKTDEQTVLSWEEKEIETAKEQLVGLKDKENNCNYNWLPLLELVLDDYTPNGLYGSLLSIYFSYTNYYVLYPNESTICEESLQRDLYALRSVITAFMEMQKKRSFSTSINVDIK